MPHKHSTHKIARGILLKIAQKQNKSFAKIKQLFVYECDPYVTEEFWKLLRKHYPNHQYVNVYHCPGCGKFDLE